MHLRDDLHRCRVDSIILLCLLVPVWNQLWSELVDAQGSFNPMSRTTHVPASNGSIWRAHWRSYSSHTYSIGNLHPRHSNSFCLHEFRCGSFRCPLNENSPCLACSFWVQGESKIRDSFRSSRRMLTVIAATLVPLLLVLHAWQFSIKNS